MTSLSMDVILLDQRNSGVHAKSAKMAKLRVHNPPSWVKEGHNLLFVRPEEEVVGPVRDELSLAHRAGGSGNSSSTGI